MIPQECIRSQLKFFCSPVRDPITSMSDHVPKHATGDGNCYLPGIGVGIGIGIGTDSTVDTDPDTDPEETGTLFPSKRDGETGGEEILSVNGSARLDYDQDDEHEHDRRLRSVTGHRSSVEHEHEHEHERKRRSRWSALPCRKKGWIRCYRPPCSAARPGRRS